MSKKIVIADDEAHILHVVCMKLRNAGYEVVTAVDGEEALDLCEAECPDLLITDYQMPYMDGLELCDALRESDATRGIPAMMLTAHGFDIDPARLKAAGVQASLAKPFSPRELLSQVEELLNQAVGTG